MIRSADIFCRVVDNLGDAGVCWRLARQLARWHALQLRLFIDAPATLDCFVLPGSEDAALLATGAIRIEAWTAERAWPAPADLAIETFGCDLPQAYAAQLALRGPAARWYNLEYLSAEAWVAGCHGLPSPHPRLPVTRWFFFPGFSAGTGGLLREPDLLERRRRFDAAWAELPVAGRPVAPRSEVSLSEVPLPEVLLREVLLREVLLPEVPLPLAAPQPDTPVLPGPPRLRVGLFCYASAPLTALLDAFEAGAQAVDCQVFRGPAQAVARDWSAGHPGHRVHFEWLPWLDQEAFDALLWSCDFNLVRGEDSFVRAQWAGRPFAWDIYPQDDGAHLVKRAAFLELYQQGLAAPAGAALDALWCAWVQREPGSLAAAWAGLLPQLPALRAHAERWCAQQSLRPDLASALLAHAAQSAAH